MPFEVIPAIDLRGGKCVRLLQGDYAKETIYSDDPVEMALRWQELGAPRLHVVDLDGARSGYQANSSAVRAIVNAVSIPVELGGGVRDLDVVSNWLKAGVERVFLGTVAVADPDLAAAACKRFPGHVAAGADARDGRIAVRGWEVESAETVVDFARRLLEGRRLRHQLHEHRPGWYAQRAGHRWHDPAYPGCWPHRRPDHPLRRRCVGHRYPARGGNTRARRRYSRASPL